MTETILPASHTSNTQTLRVEAMVHEVEQQFRGLDSGVFFVLPRIVRRVLQNELHIAGNWVPPPHRKSSIIDRERLLWLVARDELGIAADASLPQRLILIARPEENRLPKFSSEGLLRYYWRLLFHARMDYELELTTSSGRMTMSELRRRIDSLGQTQFDEIRSVLRAENMLRRPDDSRHVYAEFVAVYHELRAFAPDLVPLYFPSLACEQAVLALIGLECDAAALLEATRPPDLIAAQPVALAPSTPPAEELHKALRRRLASRSPRKYEARIRAAHRLRAERNNVHAALSRLQALEVAPLDKMDEARAELSQEIELLVVRLQAALDLTDEEVRPWLAMCELLLSSARQGFWNANVRLLYDLQQVCLDHEMEIYNVNLPAWAFSRGRVPLKRPLPSQRVVLLSKHLQRAASRVPAVLIDDAGRHALSQLLQAATAAAEQILRNRFEPLVAQSLTEVGFDPQGVAQQVAFRKMTTELLDGIVRRSFLTLGDLRDTISRNPLKIPDLTGVREFFTGDPLLRADSLLADHLDGVYQPGPFYLRWLQRLNSLTFGIPAGRVVSKYIAMPFVVAFFILMMLDQVTHHAEVLLASLTPVVAGSYDHGLPVHATGQTRSLAHIPPVCNRSNMLLVGCLILLLMEAPDFRRMLFRSFILLLKILRIALIEIPRRIAKSPVVAWLLNQLPVMLFRRFVVAPLIVTGIVWNLVPAPVIARLYSQWWGLSIFIVSMLVLNSRAGRDTEELTRELFARTWYRIRVHLLLGMLTLIVDSFHWLMDRLERVLYAVSEWLRFRSGESMLILGTKAVLGVVWLVVDGPIRFCVTLLIEPQLNPIKLPIVTVSHKLMLPLVLTQDATQVPSVLAEVLLNALRPFTAGMSIETANWIMGSLVWCIPGVIGFLAWELSENWKLYVANRSPNLQRVRVGHHGETLLRLLRPGFHSGTIPRLFALRRRAARKFLHNHNTDKRARFAEKLHQVAEGVRHFVQRELVDILQATRTFRDDSLKVGTVELATNRILISICERWHPDKPVLIQFAEQTGWLVADVSNQGWLRKRSEAERNVFCAALAGLYHVGSVDLVREQIESLLVAPRLSDAFVPRLTAPEADHASEPHHPYDISAAGLVIWPYRHYEAEVHYSLESRPISIPRPRSLARATGLNPLPLSAILFHMHPVNLEAWQAYWETEHDINVVPIGLLPNVELLRPIQCH